MMMMTRSSSRMLFVGRSRWNAVTSGYTFGSTRRFIHNDSDEKIDASAVSLRLGLGEEREGKQRAVKSGPQGGVAASQLSGNLHQLRRFYREARVDLLEQGSTAANEDDEDIGEKFSVTLDGRAIKTPYRYTFYAPTEELAWAVALEWDSQKAHVNTFTMPMMTLITTTIDKLVHGNARLREELIAQQVNFITTDHAVFRSDRSGPLLERQEEILEPIVQWFEKEYRVRMPRSSSYRVEEPEIMTVNRVHALLYEATSWELACIDSLTAATKSLIMSMAALRGRLGAEEIFEACRIDESYQQDYSGSLDGVHDLSALDIRKSISAAVFCINSLPSGLRRISSST